MQLSCLWWGSGFKKLRLQRHLLKTKFTSTIKNAFWITLFCLRNFSCDSRLSNINSYWKMLPGPKFLNKAPIRISGSNAIEFPKLQSALIIDQIFKCTVKIQPFDHVGISQGSICIISSQNLYLISEWSVSLDWVKTRLEPRESVNSDAMIQDNRVICGAGLISFLPANHFCIWLLLRVVVAQVIKPSRVA